MEIRVEDAEWAVMDRLRQILEGIDKIGTEYTVTLSLSLLLSVVAWGRQRLGENNLPGERPENIKKVILLPITSPPWSVSKDDLSGDIEAYPQGLWLPKQAAERKPFAEAHAWELVVFLRNSMAHGDHRNITPWIGEPLPVRAERKLLGFEICSAPGGGQRVPLTGSIRLTEETMVRVGKTLADAFCKGYGLSVTKQQDATKGLIERRIRQPDSL